MSKDATVVKMHNFRIVTEESYKKGTLRRVGKGTIMRIMDQDCWVYECGRCQTKFQLNAKMDIADVNREATLRFPCL